MKEKFTPGPWEYDSNHSIVYGRGARYAKISETPEGYMPNSWNEICYLKWKFDYIKRDYALDNARANARLIAAAPDMYEALKALVEGIDQYDGFVALGDMVTARAAIAKAEGKS